MKAKREPMQQMLYRPEAAPTHSCRTIHAPREPQEVSAREKVLAQVVELERKMQEVKTQADVDFSLIQTYKEMIASRMAYYEELSKS